MTFSVLSDFLAMPQDGNSFSPLVPVQGKGVAWTVWSFPVAGGHI